MAQTTPYLSDVVGRRSGDSTTRGGVVDLGEISEVSGRGYDKFDGGKAPMYEFCTYPVHVLEDEAWVLKHGADKYGRNNWHGANPVEGMETYLAAAFRHLHALLDGEVTDEESGKPHTAHVRCCMGFVQTYLERMDSNV